eukprot:1651337-Prymnesium_polylepis.1
MGAAAREGGHAAGGCVRARAGPTKEQGRGWRAKDVSASAPRGEKAWGWRRDATWRCATGAGTQRFTVLAERSTMRGGVQGTSTRVPRSACTGARWR